MNHSPTVAGLTPERTNRLGDGVYKTLLNELVSGAIEPGSRIMIDRLARIFNVSQTPIREALLRLEAQGLVTKTHLVGYRAAERMTRQRFEDLYEMRLLLEPFAAQKCVERATDEQVEKMLHQADAMNGLLGQETYAAFAQQDAELHEFIAACSGNELLHDSLSALHSHLHLFRLQFSARGTSDALAEHDLVVSAIRDRNAPAASAAMQAHIEHSRDRLLASYSARAGKK